jgi:hypothetical protein
MLAKRYVLLVADSDLSAAEMKELRSVIGQRYPEAKVIEVEGSPRAAIIKTTNAVAPLLRDPDEELTIGGKRVRAVLTSGAVGNLKRRAPGAGANGQVHE